MLFKTFRGGEKLKVKLRGFLENGFGKAPLPLPPGKVGKGSSEGLLGHGKKFSR